MWNVEYISFAFYKYLKYVGSGLESWMHYEYKIVATNLKHCSNIQKQNGYL